jgi:hypothetical protein
MPSTVAMSCKNCGYFSDCLKKALYTAQFSTCRIVLTNANVANVLNFLEPVLKLIVPSFRLCFKFISGY